jgi:hypothetical protein
MSPDDAAGKHRQQRLVVSRPLFWFVAEEGGDHLADGRPVLPCPVQRFQKDDIDAVEDLIASPAEIDDKIGDELFPIDLV